MLTFRFRIGRTQDGISNGTGDYDFTDSSIYTYNTFDARLATDAYADLTEPPAMQIHPLVEDGTLRLTETWQSLTQTGTFPGAKDGGEQFPLVSLIRCACSPKYVIRDFLTLDGMRFVEKRHIDSSLGWCDTFLASDRERAEVGIFRPVRRRWQSSTAVDR